MKRLFDIRHYNHYAWVAVLATIAAVLRLLLIFKNGQVVHGDGMEYFTHSRQVYTYLIQFDITSLFKMPVPHWGGVLFGAIPFFFSGEQLDHQEKMSAVFFAIPAVINIFLIYIVALRYQFGQLAALIAAFLYTFSLATIYQVRQVLLHELAILFFLLALVLVASPRAHGKKHTLVAGFFCFLTFFTYYGFWILAAAGLIFIMFYRARSAREVITHGMLCGTAFVFPLVLIWLGCHYAGADFIKEMTHFSATINQGSMDEGYSLPFNFFFHAEGFLFVVWLLCLCVALFRLADTRVRSLCAGILFIYGMLVLGSNVLHHFVVLGRLTKQLVPLLCLLSALILSEIKPKILLILVLSGVAAGFFYDYQKLYRVRFDNEIQTEVDRYQSSMPAGRILKRVAICTPHHPSCGVPLEGCKLVSINMPYMYNFPFFQYEVLTPELRNLLKGAVVYDYVYDCPIN